MTLVPIKRLEFAASWPRLHYLARRIAPNSRVLNIGIGGGEFETAADRRELELFQLDPSLKTVEAARQRSEVPQRVSIGYVQDMPFDNDQFDAVVASELLEHLTDEILAAALVEIARVLRPGGHFLGTVPAGENLEENTMFCPHCQRRFHRWGHEQSFSVQSMADLLSTRFHTERVAEKQFVHWPQLNWRGKLIATTRLILAPLTSSGKNLVFFARKRSGSIS
ncbi:MAG: class I SAM-dependent methyltransferase [Planctomycetaceae bacterium]|mgnify:FL=1|nr:class I SAM-dependent methyltransferase [Planctomycetaceae bacterium]